MEPQKTFNYEEAIPPGNSIGMIVIKDAPFQDEAISICLSMFGAKTYEELYKTQEWNRISEFMMDEDKAIVSHLLVASRVVLDVSGQYDPKESDSPGSNFWDSQYGSYSGQFFFEALKRSLIGKYVALYISGDLPQKELITAMKKLKGQPRIIKDISSPQSIIVESGSGIRGIYPVESFSIDNDLIMQIGRNSPQLATRLLAFTAKNGRSMSFLNIPHEYQPALFDALDPNEQVRIVGSPIHTPDDISIIVQSLSVHAYDELGESFIDGQIANIKGDSNKLANTLLSLLLTHRIQ
ncbi:hypothetical protein A2982_00710 [candidate division WWE3 bacterium RIFCSPLOWO2_01_FULL_39_13]|uniref:Uncharacterized protein n=1 Tax=candidate division WWE3 bacterium RIFCSPLOWO2_01_FULL_39_13 TaxID=1802624 RepID=A0A1F4V5B6_UNCKA|nr:MAG: hypothetical protein A2982_00710 [candidate division WWE3 bacterium RIFCSPLOWO2_01_FULL_39_13]